MPMPVKDTNNPALDIRPVSLFLSGFLVLDYRGQKRFDLEGEEGAGRVRGHELNLFL